MNLTVVGTGYVGLVTGACLADAGNRVLCVDLDATKIEALAAGRVPIFEPGLEPIVARNRAAGRLAFTTDVAASVAHGELQLIAVGTPPGEDGAADVTQVLEAARAIGRHMRSYKVVATKSTVPVGTADRIRQAIGEEMRRRGVELELAVVSNPEFLKEGAAVEDFMRPERIIVGSDDERAIALLRSLYAPFQRNRERMMVMGARSAELTKYAANSMLATRISFMNELANLAETLGADIEQVRRGIGADPRIGSRFLYAGAGFGGSCFPKDVKALQRIASEAGRPLRVLAAVEQVNEAQKHVLGAKIRARFGADLSGRRFAIWGLAFKPETDDLREAPARTLIADLLGAGAAVRAYDPAAGDGARRLYAGEPKVEIAASALAALEGADALAIVTEWREFRSPDFAALKARLKTPAVFDGRNLYDPAAMRAQGIEYHPIGRKT
ncbi:MAG: UDP-glucose 6-dehydrogenase [Betaproteobacteria bacterium RIFCSPHIGHO2_12_FULL_69_13]|nr:MAG: UDP-glucose 6-dehydrogenase [Betaproteobacteria bacterium RIFCSPHIGHO2_12_FULL_69_13]OGA69771.1 MAG: UDP-glucose 6-dehydrogenase [Betaproteobacteria bacterium RIFCSPLOWO2_12_FULL_68_20]